MLLAHPTENLRCSRGFHLDFVMSGLQWKSLWNDCRFILSCCFPCTDTRLDIAIKERISNLACSQTVFFNCLPQLKPGSPLLTMLPSTPCHSHILHTSSKAEPEVLLLDHAFQLRSVYCVPSKCSVTGMVKEIKERWEKVLILQDLIWACRSTQRK